MIKEMNKLLKTVYVYLLVVVCLCVLVSSASADLESATIASQTQTTHVKSAMHDRCRDVALKDYEIVLKKEMQGEIEAIRVLIYPKDEKFPLPSQVVFYVAHRYRFIDLAFFYPRFDAESIDERRRKKGALLAYLFDGNMYPGYQVFSSLHDAEQIIERKGTSLEVRNNLKYMPPYGLHDAVKDTGLFGNYVLDADDGTQSEERIAMLAERMRQKNPALLTQYLYHVDFWVRIPLPKRYRQVKIPAEYTEDTLLESMKVDYLGEKKLASLLLNGGIETIGDALNYSWKDFWKINQIGKWLWSQLDRHFDKVGFVWERHGREKLPEYAILSSS